MKRLIVSAFAAIVLIAAATTVLQSHAPSANQTASMPSLQQLHSAAGVNKLPTEEFEDMSLVYSTKTAQ